MHFRAVLGGVAGHSSSPRERRLGECGWWRVQHPKRCIRPQWWPFWLPPPPPPRLLPRLLPRLSPSAHQPCAVDFGCLLLVFPLSARAGSRSVFCFLLSTASAHAPLAVFFAVL